jgi:hypothetical protein
MLRFGKRKGRRIDERKKKAFKDLDYRGKKRDGAVGGTNVKGFAGLENGDDVSGFPYGGKVSRINGKIKEFCQKGDATRAKMLQVKRR